MGGIEPALRSGGAPRVERAIGGELGRPRVGSSSRRRGRESARGNPSHRRPRDRTARDRTVLDRTARGKTPRVKPESGNARSRKELSERPSPRPTLLRSNRSPSVAQPESESAGGQRPGAFGRTHCSSDTAQGHFGSREMRSRTAVRSRACTGVPLRPRSTLIEAREPADSSASGSREESVAPSGRRRSLHAPDRGSFR